MILTKRTLREIELEGNTILREFFGVEEKDVEQVLLDLVDEGVLQCRIVDGKRLYSKVEEKSNDEPRRVPSSYGEFA